MASRKVEKAEAPRFQLSEVGYNGLKISGDMIYDEIKRELQFPASVLTYKQMSYDSTIAAALSYYEHMMLKSKFKFKPHPDANQEQMKYAAFMQECIEDMEHSWQDFIQEVSSFNTYGFCVNEIVLRKRLRSKGSKFNDGKIGIQKLPIRSQDSIAGWIYSEDGRTLQAVKQSIAQTGRNGRVLLSKSGTEIIIPRKKFLLFRLGKKKDSPHGESPLKGCYYSWKYKLAAEELEGIGLQRDLSGVPLAWVPPQIMADDATPQDKAQYAQWQNIVRNIHNNQQAGLVLPLIYDPDTKLPLYKFELMKNDGGKAYDTSKIKSYYVNAMLTALSADILIMGQSTTGSYALGSIKGTQAAIAIETKLREICNVINQHLIPLIAEYNGWDITRLPKLEVEDLEATDLESWSKAVQRAASVGLVEIDREMLNKVREMLGLEPLHPDDPVDETILTGNASRAGDGMKTAGDGTSTDGNKIESNDKNLENKG